MAPFPPTAQLPELFTPEVLGTATTAPLKSSLTQRAVEDPWRFDPLAVAHEVGECDLMISLTPWHSSSLDQLLEILSPPQSLGFSVNFGISLVPEVTRNIADVFFQVPALIEPALQIEDFLGGPVVSARYRDKAHHICSQLPDRCRILAVHADTFAPKMWSDVSLRRWMITITFLCLFDAVANPSHEFSSLFNVELILREGQIAQAFEHTNGIDEWRQHGISFLDFGSKSGSNRWVILEFAELPKSWLSGVGSVSYVNIAVFTMLSYRPFVQRREIV
jgi:hypothetical protein